MTYQCKCTEKVGIVDLLPLFHRRFYDPLDGGENAVVDDQAVQSTEGLDCKIYYFGSDLWDISISSPVLCLDLQVSQKTGCR
jgi:hypothetical protein